MPVPDPTELRTVHELISQLLAVTRSAKLYSADHSSVLEMTERLHRQMKAYLHTCGSLEIEIDNEGIKWEGRPLGKSSTQQHDVIFRLYQDGVRMMTFFRGIESESLLTLIKTMLIDTSLIDYGDHDLATLLWQQRIPNIRFAVVESFLQFARNIREEGENTLLQDVEEVKKHINQITPFQAPVTEESTPLIVDDADMMDRSLLLDQVSDSEEVRSNALSHLMNILFKNLTSGDPTLVSAAQENFNLILHIIIQSADLPAINRVLDALKKEGVESLRPFYEKMNSAETVRRLLGALHERDDWTSQDLTFFLIKLEPDAVRELILTVLLWSEETALEKAEKTLKGYFRFHEETLVDLVTFFRPEQWKKIIRLSEDMPCREKILYKALNNPSEDVRLIAFKEIPEIPADWLSSLLWDASEAVRIAALDYVKRNNRQDLLEDLKVGITGKDFSSREFKEKEKWFIVAAMVGRDELLDLFISFFQRRSLIGMTIGEDGSLLAAKALGVIGSPEAADLLRKESDRITNTPKLRTACSNALSQIERKTGKFNARPGS